MSKIILFSDIVIKDGKFQINQQVEASVPFTCIREFTDKEILQWGSAFEDMRARWWKADSDRRLGVKQ